MNMNLLLILVFISPAYLMGLYFVFQLLQDKMGLKKESSKVVSARELLLLRGVQLDDLEDKVDDNDKNLRIELDNRLNDYIEKTKDNFKCTDKIIEVSQKKLRDEIKDSNEILKESICKYTNEVINDSISSFLDRVNNLIDEKINNKDRSIDNTQKILNMEIQKLQLTNESRMNELKEKEYRNSEYSNITMSRIYAYFDTLIDKYFDDTYFKSASVRGSDGLIRLPNVSFETQKEDINRIWNKAINGMSRDLLLDLGSLYDLSSIDGEKMVIDIFIKDKYMDKFNELNHFIKSINDTRYLESRLENNNYKNFYPKADTITDYSDEEKRTMDEILSLRLSDPIEYARRYGEYLDIKYGKADRVNLYKAHLHKPERKTKKGDK